MQKLKWTLSNRHSTKIASRLKTPFFHNWHAESQTWNTGFRHWPHQMPKPKRNRRREWQWVSEKIEESSRIWSAIIGYTFCDLVQPMSEKLRFWDFAEVPHEVEAFGEVVGLWGEGVINVAFTNYFHFVSFAVSAWLDVFRWAVLISKRMILCYFFKCSNHLQLYSDDRCRCSKLHL